MTGGCPFLVRCPEAGGASAARRPPWRQAAEDHVAAWIYRGAERTAGSTDISAILAGRSSEGAR